MKEIFSNQGIFVLGTADLKGIPNVVPVGAVKILNDETVLVSDQFFLKTLDNLKRNPHAAMSFWDPESGEGYQIKGNASVQTEGKIFEDTTEWIRELSEKIGHPLKSKGAVLLEITEIYSVTPGANAGQRVS